MMIHIFDIHFWFIHYTWKSWIWEFGSHNISISLGLKSKLCIVSHLRNFHIIIKTVFMTRIILGFKYKLVIPMCIASREKGMWFWQTILKENFPTTPFPFSSPSFPPLFRYMTKTEYTTRYLVRFRDFL